MNTDRDIVMVGLNYLVKRPKGYHHRVAAKVVSKIERGRPATSVHGFVLAVFRARARARARSIDHAIVSIHPSQRAAWAGIW
jgi:predicted NAD/FAD-binding protein